MARRLTGHAQPEKNMNQNETNLLIDVIDTLCLIIGKGELGSIHETWDGKNIETIRLYLDNAETEALDRGDMTDTAIELFKAARHILEAFRKEE
jgi:hypothetical protein